MSHDSINCFLCRERYEPKDLFDELVAQGWLDLVGGVLKRNDALVYRLIGGL